MCNLYSITKGQDAVRRWFGTARDMAGNLPPLPDVYPDSMAPIIRIDGDGARELRMMRWGFPPPPNLGAGNARSEFLDRPPGPYIWPWVANPGHSSK
jgi:putative SOS response-associated peptidase YedK